MSQRTGIFSGLATAVLLGALTLRMATWAQTSACVGDCNGTGTVSVDNLVRMVNVALGSAPPDVCSAGDADGDGTITIDEIIQATIFALDGCPVPTPTPTPSGEFLCSAGPHDGQACNGDTDCAPGGVCVIAGAACDGGDRDGQTCDCGAGTCAALMCSANPDGGTCQGGVNAGEPCSLSSNCTGGSQCVTTQQVCLGSYQDAQPCLRNVHCSTDSTCGSTGGFCCGGRRDGKPCVDGSDCPQPWSDSGVCATSGSACPRVFPTHPPTPEGTPVPTPAPVAFAAHVLARAADNPQAVAVADVNGDGLLDLVTANAGSDTISVLLGQPDHRFAPAAGSPFDAGGTYPASIAVADVNGDGRPDLITANRDSSNISVLLGQPDHRFVPASGSPLALTNSPSAVAVADLNGDGRLDLAVSADGGDPSSSVNVLWQQPDGSFTPASGSPFANGASCASALAVADINSDGLADLVTANWCNNSVSVLLQQPDHSMMLAPGSPFSIGFGQEPSFIAVGDLNGDGRPDLVTANPGGDNSCNCVSVLVQQADGSFVPAPASPVSVRASPVAVAIADVNGDGRLDLVTANADYPNGTVSVLLGQPDLTFIAAEGSPFHTGVTMTAVAVADTDGDGFLDIVATDGNTASVTVLRGQADHRFAPAPGSPFSAGMSRPGAITVADLTGDDLPDIVTANFASSDVTVLHSLHSHSFVPAPDSPFDIGDTYPVGLAVGDFDGDGAPDIATANQHESTLTERPGSVSVLIQQTDRSFHAAAASPFGTSGSPVAIAAMDINRDGRTDLVTAYPRAYTPSYSLDSRIEVWLAEPDRTFTLGPLSPFPLGAYWPRAIGLGRPSSIAVADLNGDGLLDLVAGNPDGAVSVALQQADHSFSCTPWLPITLPSAGYYFSIAVADLNGDGRPDIATAGGNGIVALYQIAP